MGTAHHGGATKGLEPSPKHSVDFVEIRQDDKAKGNEVLRFGVYPDLFSEV